MPKSYLLPCTQTSFFKKYLFKFMYFWLHQAFIALHGLSLAVASRGYTLVVVHGLFIAEASFVAEHWL